MPAVQALADLYAHADTVNGPDARAEVCHKLRQLEDALTSLVSRVHVLSNEKDFCVRGVHLGLQAEKLDKEHDAMVKKHEKMAKEHEKMVKEHEKMAKELADEKREKQKALDMRDTLLETCKKMKTVLEPEKRRSFEEQ